MAAILDLYVFKVLNITINISRPCYILTVKVTINKWNKLYDETVIATSANTFKSRLLTNPSLADQRYICKF